MAGEINPAKNHVAVTKSDATTYSPPLNALYIGTAGDVAILPRQGGNTVTYKSVPAGTFMPVNAYKVMSAGTTAADIVGLMNEAF